MEFESAADAALFSPKAFAVLDAELANLSAFAPLVFLGVSVERHLIHAENFHKLFHFS